MSNEKFPFIYWLKNRIEREPLPGVEAHKRIIHSNRQISDSFPDNSKQASVLLLLYPNNSFYNLVLIERTKLGTHGGQIAFPGGKVESTDTSLWHTAIRESKEEVNLHESIEPIGKLSPLYIPVSNYVLHPFVGFINKKPELLASDDEVASIIEIDIKMLFSSRNYRKIYINYPNMPFVDAYVYNLPNNYYIWGATAMVLSELEVLLESYNSQ
jgi:8-oxo-dGTP pyrophosphatase MutT (NUDIX family)